MLGFVRGACSRARICSSARKWLGTVAAEGSTVPTRRRSTIKSPLFTSTEFIGKTGGDIVHEMLRRHNVKHLFGYPGGAALPVFDAIFESKHMRLVLPRHEQGAGHMAEGYARVSGKVGVVLVTSGPGATNCITPMQNALSDGTPLVVFTGQVPTSALGTDAFQEADVLGLSRACTKWNVLVRDIADLPRHISDAFEIAQAGRPGPVLIDLPKDVTAGVLNRAVEQATTVPALRKPVSYSDPIQCKKTQCDKIARMINDAQLPVFYVGHGVLSSNSSQTLRDLAEKANVPVTTTLQGLGAFDELSPLSLHMLGMHGSVYANYAMQNADLIVAIGARFDDRVTGNLTKFAPEARKAEEMGRGGIVQLDVLPKNVDKVVNVTASLIGDCSESMSELLPLVEYRARAQWHARLDDCKRMHPFRYEPAKDGAPLKPQHVIEELNRLTQLRKDDVVITTGVGQHQMWAAQFFRWQQPRSMVTSGGLGTMGFGLPAAIGAKIAMPHKTVIDIDGDASFEMTGMELITAVEADARIKVLLMDNEFQGMVKQWQDLFYDSRHSGTVMKRVNFTKLAEAVGFRAIRVTRPEELSGAMEQFLECDAPVLLHATVDKAEHVYPMVPAGKGLHEMVLGPCDLRV